MLCGAFFGSCVFGTLLAAIAQAQVKDNSFLIEEAYNQEAGVVQFIQTYQYLDPAHEWVILSQMKFPSPMKLISFLMLFL